MIKTNHLYQHFKGALYTVLLIAKHSETGEELVIYQGVNPPKIYARPLSMWEDHIERDGFSGPRFKLAS